MKHHNKFKVRKYSDPDEFEIKFSELGGFAEGGGTEELGAIYTPSRSNITHHIVKMDEYGLNVFLNAVYDRAYEDGRKAVRVCMNEAMGFDGE